MDKSDRLDQCIDESLRQLGILADHIVARHQRDGAHHADHVRHAGGIQDDDALPFSTTGTVKFWVSKTASACSLASGFSNWSA